MDWPQQQYATIVCDPPWPVKAPARYLASAGAVNWHPLASHYAPMPLPDIAALSIPALALPDCHLFLWATNAFLPAAIAMLPQWGFRYCWTMTWHKSGGPQLPGGPSFNSEFVVYGRRGQARFRDTRAFSTAFYSARAGHSIKPASFYRLLERVTPGPRIDLFARTYHAGFDAWGDQLPPSPGQSPAGIDRPTQLYFRVGAG